MTEHRADILRTGQVVRTSGKGIVVSTDGSIAQFDPALFPDIKEGTWVSCTVRDLGGKFDIIDTMKAIERTFGMDKREGRVFALIGNEAEEWIHSFLDSLYDSTGSDASR